jgi:hypothetical protein
MILTMRNTQQKIAAPSRGPVNEITTHVLGGRETGGVGTEGVGTGWAKPMER